MADTNATLTKSAEALLKLGDIWADAEDTQDSKNYYEGLWSGFCTPPPKVGKAEHFQLTPVKTSKPAATPPPIGGEAEDFQEVKPKVKPKAMATEQDSPKVSQLTLGPKLADWMPTLGPATEVLINKQGKEVDARRAKPVVEDTGLRGKALWFVVVALVQCQTTHISFNRAAGSLAARTLGECEPAKKQLIETILMLLSRCKLSKMIVVTERRADTKALQRATLNQIFLQ